MRGWKKYTNRSLQFVTTKTQQIEAAGFIPELSVVELTRQVEHEGEELPAGVKGTVVHVWGDGKHYAVEFAEPFQCVVSLSRADIRLA